MKVKLLESTYDPWQEIKHYQAENADQHGKFGATTVFVGTMRDMNEGDEVSAMQLDHYPEMTTKHLENLAANALDKFDILDILIMHRVGEVFPNDPIVCVAVWSEHRAAAYDANRFIMEDLKSNAPIWKKETLKNTERWVEKNTPG